MAGAGVGRAAGLVGAAGVGALLHSWWTAETPANLPSRPHHHHFTEAPPALKLGTEAPRTAEGGVMGMAETWVGPSVPANTTHHFLVKNGPGSTKDKLDIGVETTAGNSVFGLLHNWFGSPDTAPAAHPKH